MPRGDGTGLSGSGSMTGRRMGSCSGSGRGGSFVRRGGGLGLLGLGMWLVRLWGAARQPGDLRSGGKDNEADELRKKIAELEDDITELKQHLRKVESVKGRETGTTSPNPSGGGGRR
ncbi:MAG TPA: DUF5320 family protein [Geobacteraceae bacterium]|nr:DUF5320 family protein [Geobacteraceae bacterium]